MGAWTGLIWLRKGTGVGLFKRDNEPSGSVKCGEFLDYLRSKVVRPLYEVKKKIPHYVQTSVRL